MEPMIEVTFTFNSGVEKTVRLAPGEGSTAEDCAVDLIAKLKDISTLWLKPADADPFFLRVGDVSFATAKIIV